MITPYGVFSARSLLFSSGDIVELFNARAQCSLPGADVVIYSKDDARAGSRRSIPLEAVASRARFSRDFASRMIRFSWAISFDWLMRDWLRFAE